MNKLNKKLFFIVLAGFFLVQPFSALALIDVTGTCADECTVGQTETLGDSYRVCGNYDSDCCYEWSQWYTNPPTCADECAYIGQRKCSDSTHYQVCGNYDSDCCLEWSSPQSCSSGQVCQNGTCVDQEVNDPITGSLYVSSYSVCRGESIAVTLTGQDDNGLIQLKLMINDGADSYSFNCSGAQDCSHTWDITKSTAGTYKLTAKFFGKKPDGTSEVYSIDDIYIEFRECFENHPPIANAGPNKEIYETESVILEGSGSDPDGDSVSYSWTCNGGTLSNSNIAQPVFYAPIVSSDTTYTCTLTVTDSHGASDSDSVNILVKEHHCLTLSVLLSANPNSGCAPLNNVDLTASVSGSASGEITYFFDCTNDGVWEKIITSNNSVYRVSDLCDYSSPGNYTAKARVQRGGLSAENTIQINVQSCYSNRPPVADAGSDKKVYENQSVTLNGSGYDPDGDFLDYYWSCNGGYLSNRYAAQPTFKAPSVSSDKYYTCRLTVTDDEGLTDSDSLRVLVRKRNDSDVSLNVSKSVKNLSRGDTKWYHSYRSADPSDRLLFQIKIESTGDAKARDVMVKDDLPDNIVYQGNLRIDNVYSSKNISTRAINIGNLSPGQTKVITFEAKVAPETKFSYGTTNLINTALAYNAETSDSDTCKIIVRRKAVAGAATDIPTGISNGILNSILFPLIISFAIVWIFKSKIIGLDKWSEKRRKEIEEYRAKKLLKKKIAQLRAQGIV